MPGVADTPRAVLASLLLATLLASTTGGTSLGTAHALLAHAVLARATAGVRRVVTVGTVSVQEKEPIDDRAAARRGDHRGHDGKPEGTRERIHG